MAQQWLSASDPFFSQFSGTVDESGAVAGPYDSQIAGLQSPQNWEAVASQLGWTGPLRAQYIGPDGNVMEDYSPEFLNWIQSKRAEGYDFVTDASQINKDRQTIGFRLPTGEVTNQRTVKVSGFGDFFKEFVLPAVGIAFGMGGFNSLMGGAGAGANALSGAGLGAMEGVGLSGNIINAATGQTIASLPTAAMTAADIGRGLGDVLGQVSQPPALETANFAPLESAVTNVTTPAAQLTDAANAMQLNELAQLQANPQLAQRAMDLAGGSSDLVPGVMGGGQFAAAGNALAPAAAAVNAITPAAAPAAGVMEGMVPGGLEAAGISPTARELMATGAVVAGAGAKPGLTGIPYLDKAIDFVASPAGAAIVSGVSNVVGGIAGANAAEKAAETQAAAADRALQLQREMYEKSLELGKPYYEAGVNALGKLTRGEVLPEPGYAFRLGEGMKALERVQAARGNMLSGGALKAGQRYAQDLASQEYGNAYNRLANIAGLGQTATTQAGTAGQNYASQAGELGLQQANALAQGRIGRMSSYGNALAGVAGAVGDYTRGRQQEQLFRDIFGRVGG
jgi:hypothetical protein